MRKKVLCEENRKSSEKISEIERKEKRDDHKSIKERNGCEEEIEKQESLSEVISYSNSNTTSSSSCFGSLVGTHAKVCIEEQSLDENNSKVVNTTCSFDQVLVDENNKGRENYFGAAQDKTHEKEFNKAIVDLTLMRKEKQGDIIHVLHKTKYGMYNWFIHILGIPRSPKVFLEVMNYTFNSCIGDFIKIEDDDILLYNKSLIVTSKSIKRNSFLFIIEHDIVDCGFPLVEKRCDICVRRVVHDLDDSSLILVSNKFFCDNLLIYDSLCVMSHNYSSLDDCELKKVLHDCYDTTDQILFIKPIHDFLIKNWIHYIKLSGDSTLKYKCSSNILGNSYVYVNSFYVKESLGGNIEDAWLYHKSVQFEVDFIFCLSYPLDYFVDRTNFKLHVSFPTTSRKEFCCAYKSRRIFYWDDDVHMLYKGVFIHAMINWVKWTHGHYLVLFLPLLLSINGSFLLMNNFLILRDSNSRTNCFQE